MFFCVRPIVLSLTRATMFNSTTLSSNSRKVHFARPLGGSEQARAISLAPRLRRGMLGGTVEDAPPGGVRGLLTAQHCIEALLDQELACPRYGRQAGVQGGHNPPVTPALACLRDIGLEQDPGPEDLGGRTLARPDERFERSALRLAEPYDVFLDHIL
jgi:hypothetical protein